MTELPPGPQAHSLVWALVNDTYAFYARCARRYGDPFTLQTAFGPVVATGRPDGVRAIYSADPETFGIFAQESVEPYLGATSLMLSSGASHRRTRKAMTPPFHAQRIRRYGEMMAEATDRIAARWRTGRSFVAQDAMHDISFDVILRVIFGVDEAGVAPLRAALIRAQNAINPSIIFFTKMRQSFGGLGPWARFQRATAALDAMVYERITAQREALARDDSAGGDDLLSLMLEIHYEDGTTMSDVEIRDELVSLVAAGHETLASALAWAFYWLHRSAGAEALRTLLDEIDGLEDPTDLEAIHHLPFLDAVCNETLRLSPILPEVTRQLNRPFELLGYSLPAGIGVGVITTIVHMDDAIYPEPERFEPERFLGRKRPPHEFAPFGGGTHRCLGAAFATFEMKIVLARLLRNYRFRLLRDRPVRPTRRSVPFGPNDAVRLVLEGRRGRTTT